MYNVTMNFHVEVCIQYEGCNSRTLMTSGALLLFSLSYVYGQKYSTQREGTFANCLRFTKLYVERPISTLCMRDIPFPETCGHAGRKRTNISPKLLFAVCRPIFNSKRRNELFSVPFQRIYPPSRAEFRDAGSSLGSLDLTSTTISRATTLTASGMVLLLRITSNSAWRDACVCMYLAHVICTRVCVCVYIRASAIRSLVPVQRSKPTNRCLAASKEMLEYIFFHLFPCVSLSPIFSSLCFRIGRWSFRNIRFEDNIEIYPSVRSISQW